MAVSPPPAPSSIDLSGLPPRVVEAARKGEKALRSDFLGRSFEKGVFVQ